MGKKPSKASQAAIGLAMLCLAIVPVLAGTIAVNPVRVTLAADKASGALVVRNNGAEPSVVQLEVVSWTQQDGKEVYTPTKDLLATPPIFTVPAGGSQVVRVGLRQAVAAREEISYRVIMQEVPPPPKPGFRGLQVALRLSVPIFVAPLLASAPSLQWTATPTPQGDVNIRVRNAGNAHVQLTRFQFLSAGNEMSPTAPPKAFYVLPGQFHDFAVRFKSPPPVDAGLRIVTQTDAGEIRADVPLSGP